MILQIENIIRKCSSTTTSRLESVCIRFNIVSKSQFYPNGILLAKFMCRITTTWSRDSTDPDFLLDVGTRSEKFLSYGIEVPVRVQLLIASSEKRIIP